MEFEVEIKEEKRLSGNSLGFECAQCGETATRLIVIGKVENRSGDDYEICDSDKCESRALDDAIESILEDRKSGKERAQINKADMEGK
jgi:hypothetical protein